MNLAEKNMSNYIDLSGQKFGRLTVIERLFERRNHDYRSALWLCRCDCGNEVRTYAGYLKSGNTKSCGCLHKESVTKHGFRHLPEYNIWRGMIDRCYNEKNQHYSRYGGRGILICDEWKESFEAFYADMGSRPSDEHSIDREDNDKGYSKDNCRWTTQDVQTRNRENNVYYELNGERKLLGDWCRDLNLNIVAVTNRIYRGWSFEEAINIPIRQNQKTLYGYNGEIKSLSDWCRELGLKYTTVWARLSNGIAFEDAIKKT